MISMAKKKVDEGEKSEYTVVTPVVLDESKYEPGDSIQLTAAQAEELGREVKK
jgi:hypothetical protein